MIGFIVALAIGFSILSIILALLLVWFFKNKALFKSETNPEDLNFNQGLESTINSQALINQELIKWSKLTKNTFIPSALFKVVQKNTTSEKREIDGVLITNFAIIMIEIKSISGQIIGDAKDEIWTKVFQGKSTQITNSIWQNDKNIALVKGLVRKSYPFLSLIIYSNRAESLEIENTPPHVIVTRHAELFQNLNDLIKQKLPPKISPKNSRMIAKLILQASNSKSQLSKQHKGLRKRG